MTYEMIPEPWLNSADVWEALLDGMPYCAMLRNLGRLAAAGLVAAQGQATALLAARLVDNRRIARAKVSPVTLLSTLLAFRRNHEVPAISAALETAFYASLGNVPAAGRRIGLILDGSAPIASTVLAMLATRNEGSASLLPACVSREDRLDTVMTAVDSVRPHLDTYPDSEVLVVISGRGGWIAPSRLTNVPAVMVAPHATDAAPTEAANPAMLTIVGFDASVPRAIAEFAGFECS